MKKKREKKEEKEEIVFPDDSLKIIAIGDPHFQPSNAADVNLFIERLEKLCLETEPDLIVILGDVLHTHERLHSQALNMAIDFFERMTKIAPTILLVGNHDYYNNQQFLTKNHWMNCVKHIKNLTVADTVIERELFNMKFLFVPYVPPGRFEEALETCESWNEANKEKEEIKAIFCHQEFMGCKMGAIQSVEGDKWRKNYPEIISGHIHSKQKPQNNIYYCGSSMQIAFGESEENIIPIFKFHPDFKDYSLKEIDLGLPRKKIVYTDIEGIEDYVSENKNQDKVKLTISGDYNDFKAFKKTKKYKEITKSGTKVVFKPKKIEVKENAEKLQSVMGETDFTKILSILVSVEKNPHLYQLHELIINGKEIDHKDIVFIDHEVGDEVGDEVEQEVEDEE